MTRENQDVTIELDEALREKDELKSKLQDNLTRISSLETLIASKVRFQNILLQAAEFYEFQFFTEEIIFACNQMSRKGDNAQLKFLLLDPSPSTRKNFQKFRIISLFK